MATAKKPAKKRQLKKPTSVREQAVKKSEPTKKRRILRAGSTIAKPLRTAKRKGGKEYYLPMPDNKVGRFLNKRRSFIPRYFRDSWAEVRLVKWPNRKETAKMTFAVFVFAAFFMTFITAIDFVLDKLFKQLILK